MTTFGSALAKLRKEKTGLSPTAEGGSRWLSQKELAQLTGLTAAYISLLESDYAPDGPHKRPIRPKTPSYEKLGRLCRVLATKGPQIDTEGITAGHHPDLDLPKVLELLSPLLQLELTDLVDTSVQEFETHEDPQLKEVWIFSDILAENIPRFRHVFDTTVRNIERGTVAYRFFVQDRLEWAKCEAKLQKTLHQDLRWYQEPDGKRLVAIECRSPLCFCRVSLSFGKEDFLHARLTLSRDKPRQAEILSEQASPIRKLASLLVDNMVENGSVGNREMTDDYFGKCTLLFPRR